MWGMNTRIPVRSDDLREILAEPDEHLLAVDAAFKRGFAEALHFVEAEREKRKEVYRAIVQTNPASNHFNVTRTVLLKLLGDERLLSKTE